MNLEEINARLGEIRTLLESDEQADLEKLSAEITDLEARKKELEDIELRKKLANEINAGAIEPDKTLTPENEERNKKAMFEHDSNEYRLAFLKGLQGKDLTTEERAAVTASAVIPTITMNKIIGIIENTPLIKAVDVTYIPGNVTYPAESTINDASWVVMGTASTDSADTYASISLSAYKLIKTVEITADVAAMAIDAFESWLVARLANKIAKAIDAGIINGGGSTSGQCLGIAVSKSTQDGTYTKNGMKWSDIPKIIGKLPTEYLANASFVMNRTMLFEKIYGLQTSQGAPVVLTDPQAPAKFTIMGFPVIVDDNCTSGDILFGDLKAYKFNFAQAPEVKSDDSVGFRSGSRVYRAMALADGKLGDTKAIVRFIEAT